MNKLNKEQQENKNRLNQKIHDELDNVEEAINTLNERVKALYAELIVPAVDKLNLTLEEVRNFADEVKSEAQDYFDERSEKWQEGDKGQQYQEWINSMETVAELEDIETVEPDDLMIIDDIYLEREILSSITDSPEG